MKRIIIIYLLVSILPLSLMAQTAARIDSFIIKGKQQLYYARNTWKEHDLFMARAYFERLVNNPNYSWLIHYYIALADHRLVSFYFSKEDKDNAKKFIDDGIEHLKSCIEKKNDFPCKRNRQAFQNNDRIQHGGNTGFHICCTASV